MEGGGDGLGSQHARRREGDEEERRSEDTFFDGLAKSKDAAHEAVEGQHDAKERWLAAVKAHVKEGVERNHRRDMNYWNEVEEEDRVKGSKHSNRIMSQQERKEFKEEEREIANSVNTHAHKQPAAEAASSSHHHLDQAATSTGTFRHHNSRTRLLTSSTSQVASRHEVDGEKSRKSFSAPAPLHSDDLHNEKLLRSRKNRGVDGVDSRREMRAEDEVKRREQDKEVKTSREHRRRSSSSFIQRHHAIKDQLGENIERFIDSKPGGAKRLERAGIKVSNNIDKLLRSDKKVNPQAAAARKEVRRATQGSFNLVGLLDNLFYGTPLPQEEGRAKLARSERGRQGRAETVNHNLFGFFDDDNQHREMNIIRTRPAGFKQKYNVYKYI